MCPTSPDLLSSNEERAQDVSCATGVSLKVVRKDWELLELTDSEGGLLRRELEFGTYRSCHLDCAGRSNLQHAFIISKFLGCV